MILNLDISKTINIVEIIKRPNAILSPVIKISTSDKMSKEHVPKIVNFDLGKIKIISPNNNGKILEI